MTTSLAFLDNRTTSANRLIYRDIYAAPHVTPYPPEYLDWLKADNQIRIILVEVQAYSGGSVVTRYLSDGDFVSQPSDTPANRSYTDGFVVGTPQFSARISEVFTGSSTPVWGDLEISNFNGKLDDWLDDGWDGRSISIYLGDPTWAKSQFELIMVGTVDDIYAKDQKTLALKVRDKQWLLNVPVQTNLIGGSTANKDREKPLCYGPCRNVEPVLIDAALSKYQVHDGAINAITEVRDNGVSVAYTADLVAGTFVLTSEPEGRITADVEGAKPGGSYLVKCADIMWHLITSHTSLSVSDLDSDSLSAFNSTCPQTLNLYVRDRENLIDVLDSLITSVGGWYTFSRQGLLQFGRLQAPAGTAQAEFTADDVAQGSLRVLRRITPIATVLLGYQKNWTVQTDGLAGAVSEADRALYAAEYLPAKATDPTILTAHPLAPKPQMRGTLIALEADAVDEAERLLTLYGSVRKVLGAEGFAVPFSTKLGQVVNLTNPNFGFSAGGKAVVVGLRELPTRGRVEPELFV